MFARSSPNFCGHQVPPLVRGTPTAYIPPCVLLKSLGPRLEYPVLSVRTRTLFSRFSECRHGYDRDYLRSDGSSDGDVCGGGDDDDDDDDDDDGDDGTGLRSKMYSLE